MSARRAFLLSYLVPLLLAPPACHPGAPVLQHRPLGEKAASLRAAFNADAGRTRIVLLLSPT